jgi:hypothetical protein
MVDYLIWKKKKIHTISLLIGGTTIHLPHSDHPWLEAILCMADGEFEYELNCRYYNEKVSGPYGIQVLLCV